MPQCPRESLGRLRSYVMYDLVHDMSMMHNIVSTYVASAVAVVVEIDGYREDGRVRSSDSSRQWD